MALCGSIYFLKHFWVSSWFYRHAVPLRKEEIWSWSQTRWLAGACTVSICTSWGKNLEILTPGLRNLYQNRGSLLCMIWTTWGTFQIPTQTYESAFRGGALRHLSLTRAQCFWCTVRYWNTAHNSTRAHRSESNGGNLKHYDMKMWEKNLRDRGPSGCSQVTPMNMVF